MYKSFFGFTEKPFSLTPDPRYLFLSSSHQEALDHLLYGINERKGFILISGGIGTGKTTLCRVLLDHLDEKTKSALILNSFISDMELLRSINQEFGVNIPDGVETKKDYIDALNNFLLTNFSEGGNAVILIDEAQNLSFKVLEQLRMLSNLETEREKLIQIILVGQPELKEIVSAPSLRQLDERITVRYYLNPLNFKDIEGYVEHRMIVAGGRGNVRFSKAAFSLLYNASQGNPRRINSICDRALLIAYTNENFIVSKAIIKKAIKDLYGNQAGQPASAPLRQGFLLTAVLILFLALAGILGFEYIKHLSSQRTANEESVIIASPAPKTEEPAIPEKTKDLFLDEKRSISTLFTLFYSKTENDNYRIHDFQVKFVNYRLAPEYYVMLKKPFRVSVAGLENSGRFMVIDNTKEGTAVAFSPGGESSIITREFILNHWGEEVSWIYPMDTKNPVLHPGMKHDSVSDLQKALLQTGYLVNLTGIYDDETTQAVIHFQNAFGLHPDGIAGPVTRALLYQMVE